MLMSVVYWRPMEAMRLSTLAMYAFCASSLDLPLLLVHAANFALPFRSKKPGAFDGSASPTVACLNKPYSSNRSLSLGRDFNFFTSRAALSNCSCRDMMINVQVYTLITRRTNKSINRILLFEAVGTTLG